MPYCRQARIRNRHPGNLLIGLLPPRGRPAEASTSKVARGFRLVAQGVGSTRDFLPMGGIHDHHQPKITDVESARDRSNMANLLYRLRDK